MMFYDTVDADVQYNVKLSVCLFPDSVTSLSVYQPDLGLWKTWRKSQKEKKKEQKNKNKSMLVNSRCS